MILDLNQLIKKYNMDITGVIHVGAHHGGEYPIYKNLGIKKMVYFEPVSKTFKKLEENVVDDNAILHNVALGNMEGEVEMYVEDLDRFGSSSILKPTADHIGYSTYSEIEKVQIKRLDSYNYTGYNFLNIDVQGYELEVLMGAEETLYEIDYVMCEINRITSAKAVLYENAALVDEIKNYLSPYGFSLVEENWAGVSWGDGLFIKIQ